MSGSILVVGSVAFDSVKTPFGEVDEILGGSATYFSVASSYFAPVRVVAVVGSDFEDAHIEVFRKHKIDIEGLKRTDGRTFRWKGEYGYDLNEARTLDTQLNVFETFKPVIPDAYPSIRRIAKLKAPLLSLHGDRDEVVPLSEGQALYEAAPEPKRLRVFEGLGHSDLLSAGTEYARVIKEWARDVMANDGDPLPTSGSGEPKFG